MWAKDHLAFDKNSQQEEVQATRCKAKCLWCFLPELGSWSGQPWNELKWSTSAFPGLRLQDYPISKSLRRGKKMKGTYKINYNRLEKSVWEILRWTVLNLNCRNWKIGKKLPRSHNQPRTKGVGGKLPGSSSQFINTSLNWRVNLYNRGHWLLRLHSSGTR